MEEKNKNYFEVLNNINVQDKVEQKNGLSYLSWAYAWGEIKKIYPTSTYKIYERETEYGPVNYFTDGKTCWVKTGVTINGIEHIEELPVMDYKNKSIALENITSFDVNKAIQRSLTKAIGRHGLGLYIYAGEDLPEEEKKVKEEEKKKNSLATPRQVEILSKIYKDENLTKLLQANNITKLEELSLKKASEIIKQLREKKAEVKENGIPNGS